MDTKARRALETIRQCVDSERYRLTRHFQERMDYRGMVWADVLALLDDPERVKDDGRDAHDRPKWIIGGTAADGLNLDMVCVLDLDEAGDWTVFITIY